MADKEQVAWKALAAAFAQAEAAAKEGACTEDVGIPLEHLTGRKLRVAASDLAGAFHGRVRNYLHWVEYAKPHKHDLWVRRFLVVLEQAERELAGLLAKVQYEDQPGGCRMEDADEDGYEPKVKRETEGEKGKGV